MVIGIFILSISSYLVDVAISKDMDIIAYGEDNNVVVWRNP